MASVEQTLEFYYFPLFAKVAGLFALEHSGLKWTYKKPAEWGKMKAELSWGCLPVLKNLPADHSAAFSGGELGQEVAILNYVAARVPEKMRGATVSEEMVSQQLLGVAEDIYQALVKIKAKTMTPEASVNFWTKEAANATVHNRNYGLHVYLDMLEKFVQKCGLANQGKFTSSGCTIGECKLFASMHACMLIDDTVLAGYEGMSSFYERFKKEPATQAILQGDRTEGVLAQYFYKPEGM